MICMIFNKIFIILHHYYSSRRNVDVSVTDFETHFPSSTLTEALLFSQEGHPELKVKVLQ